MCSFFSPSPYDRSHGSPGGGGGQEASTWTLFRSPECMSLSVDAMDEEEVAPVRNSLKPPGAGDGAAGGGSGLPATQITSNSRVNELLECPVCTNTMYPPIHQAFCSAAMDILFVHPASQGFRTNALLVDKSLETLGV
ncbi:Seven in absentia protein family [Musa troglodytarum]|uniref:Seven in absentia protein family n=1 Tax=Musa troglodytarum TaxID=320322 RepID=A0A9E7I8J5_9LILI|nr:Seven in absentia protein family [Musa troglodytarum]